MSAAIAELHPYLSPADYLKWEKSNELRHEYHAGKVIAMAGGTFNHNRVIRNFIRLLDPIFDPRGCEIFFQDVKLEARNGTVYTYPDVVVTCDAEDLDGSTIVRNPGLVIEVLSKSTEKYDRTFKFDVYTFMPSVKYYLLVSQDEVKVQVFSRQEAGRKWLLQIFRGLDEIIELDLLDCQVTLADIYRNIEIGAENEEE